MTSNSNTPTTSEFRQVWNGDDQQVCVLICSLLRNAEIPFRVDQHHRQFFKGLDESFTVAVPVEFHGAAKKIVRQDALHMDNDNESSLLDQRAEKPRGNEKSGFDHDPGYQPALGATSEISSQRSIAVSSMIESALVENDIASRTELGIDGLRKIFVDPRDRGRAREIARQIETESTPE